MISAILNICKYSSLIRTIVCIEWLRSVITVCKYSSLYKYHKFYVRSYFNSFKECAKSP